MLVFDVIELKNLQNSNSVEGARKFIDVMVKDSRYDSTGGWAYEEFFGNVRSLKSVDQIKCFQCHKRVEAKGFVFSSLRP